MLPYFLTFNHLLSLHRFIFLLFLNYRVDCFNIYLFVSNLLIIIQLHKFLTFFLITLLISTLALVSFRFLLPLCSNNEHVEFFINLYFACDILILQFSLFFYFIFIFLLLLRTVYNFVGQRHRKLKQGLNFDIRI